MLSADREKIVEAVCSTEGIRWRHQGRSPQTGFDCAGLIIWVGWTTGHLPRDFDIQGYRREPDGRTLAGILASHAEARPWPDWQPGDFVLLRDISTVWPCHLGFLIERHGSEYPNLIHCWARLHKKVVTVRFDEKWQEKMVGLYCFKGVS